MRCNQWHKRGKAGTLGAVLAAVLAAGAALASVQEELTLPSGQIARFHEVVRDGPEPGLVYRFRFVAPGLAEAGLAFEELMADLEYLCRDYAVPRIADIGPRPGQVVISLAEREVEFGEITPDVMQVFEAYRIEDGDCIWEMF